MAPSSLILCRAIRQARQERSWTQMELAQRMGVSQSAISFWERGIETPSLAHQIKLVTLLPEIFEQLTKQQTELLARLYQLERAIGRCNCRGCGCTG